MSVLSNRTSDAKARHLSVHGDDVVFKSRGAQDITTQAVVHQEEWDVEGMAPGDRMKRLRRVIELQISAIQSPRQGDTVLIEATGEEWAVDFVMGSKDGWHVVMAKRDEAMTTAGRRLSPRG